MSAHKTKTKDHIAFWSACLVYVLLFLFVCSARTGNGVLKFKYASLSHLVVPNKWGLYTKRTAIEKVYEVYKVENGRAVRLDNRPFASQMFYGLSRHCKIIGCETDLIACDTTLPAASKYFVSMPQNGDINNYIKPDTLRYTSYHSKNTLYLKGRLLVTIAEPDTWQQARRKRWPAQTVTVIPVNITPTQ